MSDHLTLINGSSTIGHPGEAFSYSGLTEIDYQALFNADGLALLGGHSELLNSDLTVNPGNFANDGTLTMIKSDLNVQTIMDNDGTLNEINSNVTANAGLENTGKISELNSTLTLNYGDLDGAGTITDINSTTTAPGMSDVVNLLDHSNLWVSVIGFIANIDATSEIHITGTGPPIAHSPPPHLTLAEIASILTSSGGPDVPFKGLFTVNSLTPGYTPTAEFTFNGGAVTGITIVDKPTMVAHS
jgi:hypothetical protein